MRCMHRLSHHFRRNTFIIVKAAIASYLTKGIVLPVLQFFLKYFANSIAFFALARYNLNMLVHKCSHWKDTLVQTVLTQIEKENER